MLFVWFIYGLAFFVLGLVILVYPKKPSVFKLADDIWLIAGFGIVHGINEWLDMFLAIGKPFPPDILKIIRLATLVGSFLFLLRFGTKVISEKIKHRFIQVLPVVLLAIWVIIIIICKPRLLMGDIFGRYLLCVPGTLLTALGLFLQIPQFKEAKLPAATRNLRLAAIVFIFYMVFAGLFVKEASFFPASFLNYPLFMTLFHVPVQILRAVCAILLAYSNTKLLSIFRWETREILRRSELRCSTITSAAPIILFVQDRRSVITFIQGKGLELLGLESKEIIGRHILDVFPSVPQLDQDSQRALSGEEFVTSVTFQGITFECCYSPLRDKEGEVTDVIGVFLDITIKVKAQEEMDKYRRMIEKDARMVEIGTMGSVMAQQLDEPLSLTHLLLKRLLSDLGESSAPETITSNLRKSLSEVSQSIEIVDRFRSAAQISGQSIIAPVDIYQIAKRVMTVFAQSAKSVNLNIALKDMSFVPFMSMTAREIEQIFFILIQNAIDAADSNKKQKLIISCEFQDKQIELRFTDTCAYIEPERLQHIFEPFFTGEPDARGKNFDLAIAKEIIRTHDGSITAESRPDQGTTFRVILPVQHVH
ncbi:MAG: PAS domain-containing protein [Planctomycetes bacterium]|nr:PAS domain-containing protein [Planctomycetota bacterium]MBL7145934.1 PAS domain-containing protein [Phycisphaerae bacterium]